MKGPEPLGSSFRDPSGFVFRHDGAIYRQVNQRYRPAYDQLVGSGLAARLQARGELLPFEEADRTLARGDDAYTVLRPEPLPFVSHPYEWCPSQLRDAALLTLRVQQAALDHGMTLKDASAYNVQFVGSRPVFIDHLSFDRYEPGTAWQGYRQFCQHFLAPLALACLVDVRLTQLLRVHLDGIPLDLAARLLPWRSHLRLSLLAHVHLHMRSQARYRGAAAAAPRPRAISPAQLRALVRHLEGAVRRLEWRPPETEWADYYAETNYTPDALRDKQRLVLACLDRVAPRTVWDLGGNVGLMSRLASGRGIPTVSFDVDPVAVERSYGQGRAEGDRALLPLWLDLTNPSPALGWANRERDSLAGRGPADLVMALALVHHLAISNNLPFDRLAAELGRLGQWLLVEFVPKEDSQVQRLLATRADIFDRYAPGPFEAEFARHFEIVERAPIAGSRRTLYLMESRRRSGGATGPAPRDRP
jgi:hypothetical protein